MNVSNKTKIRVAKSLCFISIFLILLSITSGALIPNHNHAENVGYKLSILNTKEDICDIDVFFIGKSHMENGVSPMKIYKDNGITTYNLSSAAQPITGAKYLVEEIFNKGGAPQVIMLDASSMFNPISEADVRYITDNVKRDTNCLNYIYDYIFESTRNENSSHYALLENYLSLIFPIYQYHSRWDKLSMDSFDFSDNNQYFLQGYTLMSSMQQCDNSILINNQMAEKVMNNQNRIKVTTYGDKQSGKVKKGEQYTTNVDSEKLVCLEEIRDICKKNNCELIMIKVPVMASPNQYSGAWTIEKYEEVKKLTSEIGIKYIDLLYDTDLYIDWKHDTADGGKHLNLLGAEKVSNFVGAYLSEECNLLKNENYSFDNKLHKYEVYSEVAHIELAYELTQYLQLIRDSNRDLLTIIVAKDDMTSNLLKNEQNALKTLGLKTNFGEMEYNDSYIAIIRGEQLYYEGTSNRQLSIDISINDNLVCAQSAGFLDGNLSSIKINGVEYSLNGRGINIVCFDMESGLVVDRATCDTVAEEHEVVHENGHLLFDFEDYLLGIK